MAGNANFGRPTCSTINVQLLIAFFASVLRWKGFCCKRLDTGPPGQATGTPRSGAGVGVCMLRGVLCALLTFPGGPMCCIDIPGGSKNPEIMEMLGLGPSHNKTKILIDQKCSKSFPGASKPII